LQAWKPLELVIIGGMPGATLPVFLLLSAVFAKVNRSDSRCTTNVLLAAGLHFLSVAIAPFGGALKLCIQHFVRMLAPNAARR
jgi:hypothetical protein